MISFVKSSYTLAKLESAKCANNSPAEAVFKAFEQSNISEIDLFVEYSSIKTIHMYENCIRLLSEKFVVSLQMLDEDGEVFSKSLSTLLILENESSLKKTFISKMLSRNNRGFILILFNDFVWKENVFQIFLKHNVFNINLLFTDSNGLIKMISFFPFSENKCENDKPQIINTYDVGKSAWKYQNIFMNKVRNLHKCPMKVSTFDGPPAIIIKTLNGNEAFSGHDFQLIKEIAKMLNFTLNMHVLKEEYPWGFIMENGTSGGVLKRVMDLEADIGIGFYYLTQTRAKFMSFSEYSREKIVLVVPPGSPLTAFEKLFSPFSYYAWIALLLTFFVGLFVIFIIKQQNQAIQDFVFGFGIKYPYVNILDIFLNGSQTVQPKRNFARTLVTIYVVYCIIVRTLYQSALFKSLQTEQKHSEIVTVDEVIKKGFDVFMYASFQELSQGLKIHQK